MHFLCSCFICDFMNQHYLIGSVLLYGLLNFNMRMIIQLIGWYSSAGKVAPGFGIGALEEYDAEDEDVFATG